MKLKDLKKGEYFKRNMFAKKVYIKGAYDRSTKKYECGDFEDISRSIQLKGTTEIFGGDMFTF